MRIRKGSFGIIVSLLRYGKTGQHAGTSRGPRLYGTCSAKFRRPLVHRTDADSRRLFGGDAGAIVTDFYSQHVVERETDVTGMGMGVAHNVGQGFLYNAVCCYLNGGRKQGQVFWRFNLYL